MTLYAALVDAGQLAERAGCEEEQEVTEPLVVSIDAAVQMLTQGGFHNGTVIIALQWLALNRDRLSTIFTHA